MNTRFDQRPMGEGADGFDMGPGCHLRDHASEPSVDLDLAGKNTRKRLGPPNHGYRGLVA
jgi:hypothetical protein